MAASPRHVHVQQLSSDGSRSPIARRDVEDFMHHWESVAALC